MPSLVVVSNFDDTMTIPHRMATNKPEKRQQLIHNFLQQQGYKMVSAKNCNTVHDALQACHDAKYLHFLKNIWASWMAQDVQDLDYSYEDGIIPYHFPREKNDSMFANLPLWKQMGKKNYFFTKFTGAYANDMSTPIFANTYKLALESAQNSVLGAQLVLDGGCNVAYCLNTLPGHHAARAGYGGYCFLNNPALCAYELRKSLQKIAILDVDYHHGDGTQHAFYQDPHVYTVSIHADPKWDYPSYCGHVEESTASNVNLIFGKKATWQEYSPLLQQAMQQIVQFGAEAIVLSFGADTVDGDPDPSKLYGCSLSVDSYYEMGKMIGSANIKVVVTQEGGYYLDKVPHIVHNLLQGLYDGFAASEQEQQ